MFPNSEDFSNDPRARSIGRSQEFWRRESGPGRLLEGSGGAGRRAHRAQRIRQVNTAQPDCGRGAAHEGGDHLGRTTDRPLARPSSRWTGYCEDTPDPEAIPGDDVSGECRGRGDVWKPRATGIREGPRRGRSRARPRGIGTQGGCDVLAPDRPGTETARVRAGPRDGGPNRPARRDLRRTVARRTPRCDEPVRKGPEGNRVRRP